MYYANDAAQRHLGTKELRRQISRKAYERQEIANTQLSEKSYVPFNMNEAKERLERRRTYGSQSFSVGEIQKQIEYFYESKDGDDDG